MVISIVQQLLESLGHRVFQINLAGNHLLISLHSS